MLIECIYKRLGGLHISKAGRSLKEQTKMNNKMQRALTAVQGPSVDRRMLTVNIGKWASLYDLKKLSIFDVVEDVTMTGLHPDCLPAGAALWWKGLETILSSLFK